MFKHTFTYLIKILARNRQLVFWSLVFPLVLGLLFKLALGNISEAGKMEPIAISVSTEIEEDPYFQTFLDSMAEEEIFTITNAADNSLLKSEKVVAHVISPDKIEVLAPSIATSIVEVAFNQYLRYGESVVRVIKDFPGTDFTKFLNNTDSVIEDVSGHEMNMFNTYAYTLIGMQALYGYSWGLVVIYLYEANLSVKARRNFIAPTKRRIVLSAATVAAWLMNIAVMAVNLLVMRYILNVNFGSRLLPVLALVGLSSLTGVAFGIFLGVCNRKSVDTKIGLGIVLTMTMSFLSGMMVSEMKILIQREAPIVNQLNPVALVTDALYSLYYYPGLERYWVDMGFLSAVTLALLAGSAFFMRRKNYVSL